jgi:hypothetical protein
MKDYRKLLKELPSSTIVCAIGEFNPPTTAHELLAKTVKRLAEQKNSDHVIYTSPSKNSLIQEEKKVQFLNLLFPKNKFKSLDGSFETAITELNQKYKNIFVVVGTEQVSEIRKLIKENASIQIITINEKDPDANYSKMKQFATKGLYEEFKKKLPSNVRELDGRRLMNEMRTNMGLEPIKEQIVLVKDTLREKYFKGELFNEGDIVESNGEQYTIVKRGSNHLLLKEQSGNLVSKWIHDVKPLNEAVIQNNGTDKIETVVSTPDTGEEVEQKNKTKSFLTFYKDKLKENSIKEPMADDRKDNESDHDYEHNIKVTDTSEVGHTLVSPGGQDNLRRRKVKYHLGEESALERFRAASAEREKKHDEIERKRKEAAAQGKENMSGAIDRLQKTLNKEEDDHYQKAEEHKDDADSAKEAGDHFSYHMHMADHHGVMADWHYSKGRNDAGDKHAEKAADHEMTAHAMKEQVELEERAKIRKKFINGQWIVDTKNTVDENYDQTVEVATPDTTLATSEENDIDDKEIEAMIGQLSDEEIMDEYDEDELALVDDETGEEIPKSAEEDSLDEQAIMEVLSRAERMKAKFRIRRTAAKRERSTKIALKRYSNTATINKRARRLAIKLMKKRLLRGRDVNKLSVGEKERIERTLEQRKQVIGRVAAKLVSRVRKVEKARMSHTKFTQGNPNVAF